QVACGSPQPVHPREHQHIALTEALEQFGQLGPVAASAADLLCVDLGASCTVQLRILRGEALSVRRHPRIAVNGHEMALPFESDLRIEITSGNQCQLNNAEIIIDEYADCGRLVAPRPRWIEFVIGPGKLSEE